MSSRKAPIGFVPIQDASSTGGASCSFIDQAEFDPGNATQWELEATKKSAESFRLVLGSQSPRRRQLLEDAQYRFAVLPAQDGVEEEAENNGLRDAEPKAFVSALAFLKAKNVVEQLTAEANDAREDVARQLEAPDEQTPFVVVSCDCVAECKGEILGKPLDRADAERMLRRLNNSEHAVHTGLCVWKLDLNDRADDKLVRRVETSILKMQFLSEERLRQYLDSGLWKGKAGAFGYQDGNDWLELLTGTGSNVVGLPTEALAFVLTRLFP